MPVEEIKRFLRTLAPENIQNAMGYHRLDCSLHAPLLKASAESTSTTKSTLDVIVNRDTKSHASDDFWSAVS